MSPNGTSFVSGAPPTTAAGGRPLPGRSRKRGSRPSTTPWPATLLAVSVPWPLDGRVEVARPREDRARRGRDVEAEELLRAARHRRAADAVRDVVEEAARHVGEPVVVDVAVGRRRRLRHGLLVREVVVAVEVDVHGVVDAGRLRVGDQDAGPLAVALEQVVVGVVGDAHRARLRPLGREDERARDRARGRREVARRARLHVGRDAVRAALLHEVGVQVSEKTYQERPASMSSGSSSHCRVPYGSYASGQPFGADLPRVQQVGMPEVGAAVEHGDRACPRP